MKLAVRNLRMCTKDCLCLYVCPTGATDTENSIIDPKKCIGCGKCAEACPSRAISIISDDYPPQQKHGEKVLVQLDKLSKSKTETESIAKGIAASTDKDGLCRLMQAVAMSSRLMAEDLARESGYMLPQSANTHRMLEDLVKDPPKGFPVEAAEHILDTIPCNEPIRQHKD